MQTQRRSLAVHALILLVDTHHNYLSELMIGQCKFVPTCSRYAKAALEQYGAVRGVWKATMRVFRCHPLSAGGVDPLT